LPGPGSYNIQKKYGISSDGRYFHSKLVGSGATKFGGGLRNFLEISIFKWFKLNRGAYTWTR
jgi:hypothetical protein